MNKLAHRQQGKQKYRSIQWCMTELGVPRDKAYFRHNEVPKTAGTRRRSVWIRLGYDEINYLVEKFYRLAIKTYHPDLNYGRGWYVDRAARINAAYQAAKRILERHA